MSTLLFVRFVHLVAAATWLGGLIVLAALVVALRREGADRSLLQACARQFSKVSWVAMFIALGTGLAQIHLMHLPWSYGALHAKMGAVAITIGLAATHQVTARNASPRSRGMIQGLILLASLGVFAAAVAM